MILNDTLSTHIKTLQLLEQRANMLASNLTNANTPHYKAQDFDFNTAFKNANQPASLPLVTTNPNHLASQQSTSNINTLYRIPFQISLDGNTVDSDVEESNFSENAVRYQATLDFIKKNYQTLLSAVQGE